MVEVIEPTVKRLPELMVLGSEYSFEIDVLSFFYSNFPRRTTFISDTLRLKRSLNEVSQQHKRVVVFIPANQNILWDLRDPSIRRNFMELYTNGKLLSIVELKSPEDFIQLIEIPFLKKALRVTSTQMLTRRKEVFDKIALLSDDSNLGNLLERRTRNLQTETRQSIGSPLLQRSLSDFEKMAELEEGNIAQINFITFTKEELDEKATKVSRDLAKTLHGEVPKFQKVPLSELDKNALLSISKADIEPLPPPKIEETETIDYLPMSNIIDDFLMSQPENEEI